MLSTDDNTILFVRLAKNNTLLVILSVVSLISPLSVYILLIMWRHWPFFSFSFALHLKGKTIPSLTLMNLWEGCLQASRSVSEKGSGFSCKHIYSQRCINTLNVYRCSWGETGTLSLFLWVFFSPTFHMLSRRTGCGVHMCLFLNAPQSITTNMKTK